MPSHRFFFDGLLDNLSLISLKDQEHHHLHRVMRAHVGDQVEVVNGQGVMALCQVSDLRKEEATLQVLRIEKQEKPANLITLALPFLKPSKLDWVIEKGTEIGAHAFWFYPAVHTEKTGLSNNELQRLKTLAIGAIKQSGRLYLPGFHIASSLDEVFRFSGTILFGDTRVDAPLITKEKGEILFITGPEKGFSPEEVSLLKTKGKGVKLSAYVLRAETAPIVAAALLV